jgi:hypothetical protein
MRLCYYLILQQRIKEATTVFEKIDKKNIIGDNLASLELQYDYLTAYLDFSNGYPKFEKAREILKKYKDHGTILHKKEEDSREVITP